VTSHSTQSPKYPHGSANNLTHDMSTIRGESPVDDGRLAYTSQWQDDGLGADSRLDIPGQRIRTTSGNEEYLSSTPRAPSWAHEHAQHRLGASASVNSLQTEAAATPPPFVQTPSPLHHPLAPSLSPHRPDSLKDRARFADLPY
jgi:hypothetical protein